jgi:hypothetical protein
MSLVPGTHIVSRAQPVLSPLTLRMYRDNAESVMHIPGRLSLRNVLVWIRHEQYRHQEPKTF